MVKSMVHSAKKTALSELIRQMRRMELDAGKHGADDVKSRDSDPEEYDEDPAEEASESPEEEAAEDMMEAPEDNPKKQLEAFMKRGGRIPSRSRASVVIAVKSPAARMKKTFGGK